MSVKKCVHKASMSKAGREKSGGRERERFDVKEKRRKDARVSEQRWGCVCWPVSLGEMPELGRQ